MATAADLKQHIETFLPDEDTHIAYMIWQAEDVEQAARELGISLSREQINDILDDIHDSADAEYGITWNTIKDAVSYAAEVKE